MDLLPGMTGLPASQLSGIAALRGTQWRSLVHRPSSPAVTKVRIGAYRWPPAIRASRSPRPIWVSMLAVSK